jgi:magnesium transporter
MINLKTSQIQYELFGRQPGYLRESEEKAEYRLDVISYNSDEIIHKKSVSFEKAMAEPDGNKNHWLIYHRIPPKSELQALGKHFKLDNLVLENIQNCALLRPGYFETSDYFFATLKFPYMISKSEFAMTSICLIAIGKTLITFKILDKPLLNPVIDRLENKLGKICSKGVDYLAFCHIDLAVDYYFLFINQLSENLEKIEEKIILSPLPETLSELQKFKRITVSLRKSIWPLREMVHLLRNSESTFISDENEKYYIDLDNHMLLIYDNAESVREMVSGLLEIYLSSVSNRMNEVMKVLTLIATIFIPLTFIAGIYGMNFTNMPELKWHYGYFGALAVMIFISVLMLAFFRKKNWL